MQKSSKSVWDDSAVYDLDDEEFDNLLYRPIKIIDDYWKIGKKAFCENQSCTLIITSAIINSNNELWLVGKIGPDSWLSAREDKITLLC